MSDNGLHNDVHNGDAGEKANMLDVNGTPRTVSAATSTKSLNGVSVERGLSHDDESKRCRIQRL
jgi:hypothetical protein